MTIESTVASRRSATKISLAESALHAPFASFDGHAFYPDGVTQAAILCSRIVRNHALPDRNKRVGALLMLNALAEDGFVFTHPDDDEDETAEVIEALAARTISEEADAASSMQNLMP